MTNMWQLTTFLQSLNDMMDGGPHLKNINICVKLRHMYVRIRNFIFGVCVSILDVVKDH